VTSPPVPDPEEVVVPEEIEPVLPVEPAPAPPPPPVVRASRPPRPPPPPPPPREPQITAESLVSRANELQARFDARQDKTPAEKKFAPIYLEKVRKEAASATDQQRRDFWSKLKKWEQDYLGTP
jgi:hypothetical protein